MAGILFLVTSILFFVSLGASVLIWVGLWQEKEYSLRRLFIYLRETKTGKQSLIGWESLLRWVLIFFYAITIFSDTSDFLYHVAIFTFYVIVSGKIIRNILSRDL